MPKQGTKQVPELGEQTPQSPDAIKARLQDLISGKEKSPNDMVTYFLEKMKDSRAEFVSLEANLREGEKQMQALKERLLALQGEHNKYLEDIQAWWDK